MNKNKDFDSQKVMDIIFGIIIPLIGTIMLLLILKGITESIIRCIGNLQEPMKQLELTVYITVGIVLFLMASYLASNIYGFIKQNDEAERIKALILERTISSFIPLSFLSGFLVSLILMMIHFSEGNIIINTFIIFWFILPLSAITSYCFIETNSIINNNEKSQELKVKVNKIKKLIESALALIISLYTLIVLIFATIVTYQENGIFLTIYVSLFDAVFIGIIIGIRKKLKKELEEYKKNK